MTDDRSRLAARRTVTLAMLAAAAAVMPLGAVSGQSAGHIVSQPARDVGLEKIKIPPVLQRASENPYTTDGTGSCAQIASSISSLSAVLGPDFTSSPAHNRENYAKMGGEALVNSLIPFRGIVREVSGANAAERRKRAAVDAGLARRGYLHGLLVARRCR